MLVPCLWRGSGDAAFPYTDANGGAVRFALPYSPAGKIIIFFIFASRQICFRDSTNRSSDWESFPISFHHSRLGYFPCHQKNFFRCGHAPFVLIARGRECDCACVCVCVDSRLRKFTFVPSPPARDHDVSLIVSRPASGVLLASR